MIVGDINMGIVEKYNGLVAEHKVEVHTHILCVHVLPQMASCSNAMLVA